MLRRIALTVGGMMLGVAVAAAYVQTVDPVEYENRNLTLHEALILAWSRGDVAGIREAADQLISREPGGPGAADAKLLLAFTEETLPAARDRLTTVRREYPGTVWEREALLSEARLHLLWNEPALALVKLQAAEAVAAPPNEQSRVIIDPAEIAERLVSLYLSQGMLSGAGPILDEYRDRTLPSARRIRFLYLEAVWHARNNRPDDAERILNDLLVKYPGAELAGDAQDLLREIGRYSLPAGDLSNLPATLPLE
ncbi:hypothetical protein HS125_07440 [bacterium]|nr:hypothetical protein [bacterium]